MSKKKIVFLLCFIFFITAPYLLASFAQGKQHVFGGFLLNPLDGNSYLAKMMQGWSGKWEFELPYTANPGSGVYLFLFYITLGHVARILNLPVLFIFHASRVLASIFLFFAVDQIINSLFPDSADKREKAILLCFTGAGLGWLVMFSGYLPSDFWVAELFPFLSCYVNPHFPLGLALICWIFVFSMKEGKKVENYFLILFVSLALAIILPFGVIVALSALLTYTGFNYFLKKRLAIIETGLIIIGGTPMLIYQYWVTLKHPILNQWNAQNVTATPPAWDLILSCAPAIFIAGWFVVKNWKLIMENNYSRLMVAWLVSGILLLSIPFNLQRRFLTALYIPISLLAIYGITTLGSKGGKGSQWIWRSFYISSIMSNVFILILAVFSIFSHQPSIYISTSDSQAFSWMQMHLKPDSIILASPETGLRIPAFTYMKVVYGHPYETIKAEAMKKSVVAFYEEMSKEQAIAYIQNNHVKYVFWGEQEQKINKPDWLFEFNKVYKYDNTTIFQVGD